MSTAQPAIVRKLRGWQAKLLDLSHANRLLFFKSTKSSTAQITYPTTDELLLQIVGRGKTLTFPLPIEKGLFDTEEPEQATPPPPRRYKSGEVGSTQTDQQMSRVLYNLRARSRSALEEQGVNVLFLTLGMLQWQEALGSEAAHSPLVLVPVQITREALREPYQLSMLEEDLVLNPTLSHRLLADFQLQLPALNDDFGDGGLAPFLEQVRLAIRRQPTWQVLDEAHLGLFSFQKISLYTDLEKHQTLFAQHPFIASLAGGPSLPRPTGLVEADALDTQVPPPSVFQVVDADSSQQEAIEAAKRGVSFVLQGPPGTGKSQTITNIIAEFLASGKRVLFVSEKMAALEVVQTRLNKAGLGDFCLQLHSYKRDKREVVEELVKALEAPALRVRPEIETVLHELTVTRAALNAYVAALHAPRFALQLSAFRAYGELAQLDAAPHLAFSIGDVAQVNATEKSKRLELLQQLAYLPEVINHYETHPWKGATVRDVTFGLLDSLGQALDELGRVLPQHEQDLIALAAACGLRSPVSLAEAENFLQVLQVYQPAVMRLDLAKLAASFNNRYKAFYRILLPSYRKDVDQLTGLRRAKDSPNYHKLRHEVDFALRVKTALAPASTVTVVPDNPSDLASRVLSDSQKILKALAVLAAIFGTDLPLVAGQRFSQLTFAAEVAFLQNLRDHLSLLTDWASFVRLRENAVSQSLSTFVDAALTQKLLAGDWPRTYQKAFYKAFVDAAGLADEALRGFDSRTHAARIEKFRGLDEQQLKVAQARIRAFVSERRPHGSWVDAASSEQGLLRIEAAKKRRLKPLRRLLAEIPRLVLDLKPCLLMSPITVSMLLDPETYKFDLVIFDEASQIAPEDAVGALVRGQQAIVVGDRQQLPPTRFFAALAEDDVDDDEASDEPVFDSILEECEGASLPQKMLLWHYRSRHETLIAFSNYHFYHNRLFTFPSAEQHGAGLGVEFIHVPDGIYRRGKSLRRNDIEARRVVDLIFEHFTQWPERSLGVVAFSQAQQEAIRLECERRRLTQPLFEPFFNEDKDEAVFIKNLETVQGDERDAIIFSIGYGRDEAGKLTLNFGPVNRSGGERRLNVAVSRARYHVRLVSSLLPEDIDLTRTVSQGSRLLRQYMEIARDGLKPLYANTSAEATAEFESPFEQSVYDALVAKGLTLQLQVGVSGYRIDLAVVDPERPGRYLLGIECDGAMYHSGHTARDRDRLRQQVLENLGWKIHRIWSRDWLTNRDNEIGKVISALEAAWRNRRSPTVQPTPPTATATP